ncbi:hypothetical protein PENTCL1PPCAC_538, partial [Pristionchus entomophagus]
QFTNWAVLDNIRAKYGGAHPYPDTIQTLATMGNSSNYCFKGRSHWIIEAESPNDVDCRQQFTLLTVNDEPMISRPPFIRDSTSLHSSSEVVIVPSRFGMWTAKFECSGSGNVSIIKGVRYEERLRAHDVVLRSWPCESMPTWIRSIDAAHTVRIDGELSISLVASNNDEHSNFIANAGDNMVFISTGRSDRRGGTHRLPVAIDKWETRGMRLNMTLEFDQNNTQSKVELRKHYRGQIMTYPMGNHTVSFGANFFELLYTQHAYDIHALESGTPIYLNKDIVIVDIAIGTSDWTAEQDQSVTILRVPCPIDTTTSPPCEAVDPQPLTQQLAILSLSLLLTVASACVLSVHCMKRSREQKLQELLKTPPPKIPTSENYYQTLKHAEHNYESVTTYESAAHDDSTVSGVRDAML